MKAVISKVELVSLIGKIQSIVSAKPAIPILANVLIEAKNDQIILSATDLTTSMRCHAEAKVIEEGAIALPAKRFFQLTRELTSPQIKISTDENDVAEIVAGSSVFKINGMQKDEFPTLPETTNAFQISLLSQDLKEMFSKTSFSAARDDSRHILNGILIQIADQTATFIGTDGKRLSKVSKQIEVNPSFKGSYVVPLKAVEEMTKIIDEQSKWITLSLMNDKIFLEHGNATLTTKLLSGQYPDVERVIPQETEKEVKLHREELIALLRQVSLFTSESAGSVRFIFEEGLLKINGTSSEIGEGTVSMPVDYKGSIFEIAFNPFFFIDILKHSKDETVKFAFNDSFNPGKISDESSAIYVLMPMRINKPAFSSESNETENAAVN
ncbi:MAG TPA: DNA polymerase III subunit beta [Chlamydiales bacterium]|nr:DNA polymerase III subunit beta [Chlamydiales bacterium]